MRGSSPAPSADSHRHPSDPLEGSSNLPPSKCSKTKTSRDSHLKKVAKASPPSKEELWLQKAIEKAILKAQSLLPTAEAPPPPPKEQSVLSLQRGNLSPNHSAEDGPALPPVSEPYFQALPEVPQADPPVLASQPQDPSPAATAAPTMGSIALPNSFPASLEAIITKAIQQGLAQRLQLDLFPLAFAPSALQDYHFMHPSGSRPSNEEQGYTSDPSQQGSMSEEEGEESRELPLSDDEGLAPDQPAFIGLFKPQLFRSLLYKALAVMHLGSASATPPSGPRGSDMASSLFVELSVQQDTLPAPKLFMDVIQREWSLPSSGPVPNGLDP